MEQVQGRGQPARKRRTNGSGTAIVPAPQPSLGGAMVALGTIQATTPRALVEQASAMATALAKVIDKQNLFTVIKGRKHVNVEGWTTLGTMLGVLPREVSVTEEWGVYTATVELIRMSDGAVLSRASAECGDPDEVDWEGKPIWASRPRYARRSMALCVPLDAEILTRDGFKRYNEVKVGDQVLAYSTKSDRCLWTPLRAVNAFENEPVVRMHSRSFDFVCTPNHSWAVRSERGVLKLQEAEKLDARARIIIAAPGPEEGDTARPKHPGIKITEREAAILGWLVTDGTIRNPKGMHWRGHIDQTEKHVEALRSLLGNEWTTSETVALPAEGNLTPEGYPWGVKPCVRFNLRSSLVRELALKTGYRSKKDLPGIVTRLDGPCRRAMLTAMVQADGTMKTEQRWSFGKKNPHVLDAFLILCALEGKATGRKDKRFPKYSARVNRVIHNKWIRREDAGCMDVWCPTTDYGTWVMRYEDMVTITGNTRATGKACRLAFSWIMALAGYAVCPAEEMSGAHDAQDPPNPPGGTPPNPPLAKGGTKGGVASSGTTSGMLSPEQLAELRSLIVQCTTESKFCAYLKIKSIADLAASRFEPACAALRQKIRRPRQGSPMTRYFFGREAAEALIGQRVRALVEFRGVPKGTTGKVVRMDPADNNDTYTVGVEWDLPSRGKPPVDTFTRDQYYRYLEEVLGQDVAL